MKVLRLSLENYRNLTPTVLFPHEGINVIYGNNAQGKTNLIEALWLFCGQKSFRGSKDSELVAFEKEAARLRLQFHSGDRDQTAEIKITNKRDYILNDIPQANTQRIGESFCAVVFAPSHLSLIKDGPKSRRQFLDTAISQLRPSYQKNLSGYQRAVMQRNAILRDVKAHSELLEMLEVFEDRIALTGAKIISQRQKYLEALSKVAPEIYHGLSRGKETLEIAYKSSIENGSEPEQLREALKAARAEDMHTGITGVGPHRDDIDFMINSLSVKSFGSQGQQRSAVLSMKLSEAEVLKRFSGEHPIAILDDVMSELDSERQDYIFNHIKGW
ncbi:MAG: hypothetical protein BGN88_12515, partial [Clostridiales bacterium 43-6]